MMESAVNRVTYTAVNAVTICSIFWKPTIGTELESSVGDQKILCTLSYEKFPFFWCLLPDLATSHVMNFVQR